MIARIDWSIAQTFIHCPFLSDFVFVRFAFVYKLLPMRLEKKKKNNGGKTRITKINTCSFLDCKSEKMINLLARACQRASRITLRVAVIDIYKWTLHFHPKLWQNISASWNLRKLIRRPKNDLRTWFACNNIFLPYLKYSNFEVSEFTFHTSTGNLTWRRTSVRS